MKKKHYIFLLLCFAILILTVKKVDAVGTANISMWSSANTVVVGNNVTVTVDLSSGNGGAFSAWSYTMSCSSNLVWQSGDKTNELAGASTGGPITSKRFTFTYKAKSNGTATCTFKINELPDFNDPGLNELGGTRTKSVSLKIITQAQLEESYSKNNNLSSLSIEGYQLSPAFNKNTLEYSVELPNEVTKIKINATKEDSTASIQGIGEKEVSEGNNKIEIKVTAQNGSVKTYVINATVKELDPIKVTLDGEEYNVIRKESQITAPNSTFTSTTIKINDLEVPAFENKELGYILVGLKNEDGDIALYIYDEKENSYTLYQEYNFKSSIICIIDDINKIPEGYDKVKIKIDDKTVTAYQKNKNSKFYLFYGVNVETGKENLYIYDSEEETVQRYNDDEQNTENKSNEEIYQYIIIGLGSLLIITYLVLLITLINNSRKKKRLEMKKMSKKRRRRLENEENNNNNNDNNSDDNNTDNTDIQEHNDEKEES